MPSKILDFFATASPGTPYPFSVSANFRELGGYRTADGRSVRHGLFYRCAALSELTDSERKQVEEELGIRVVFDLRCTTERELHPDPNLAGARLVGVGAQWDENGQEPDYGATDDRFTPEAIRTLGEQLPGIYRQMPFHNPAFRAMFTAMTEGELPLLFHCFAGKDRTGVAAALILRTLGVPRASAMADYLRSNSNYLHLKAKARAQYALLFPDDAELVELATSFEGVDAALLDGALDAIDEKYPSFEAYLEQEYGLDAAVLDKMRNTCLEAAPALG